jgi:hypothetical protein
MEKNGEIRLGITPLEEPVGEDEHTKAAEERLEDHITKRIADKCMESISTTDEDE